MGPEINIDSILALEKQIEEGLGDTIQLKRVRNSLLNISIRMPPEILGQVFHWNVIPEGDFAGLQKGSYNFLLVCRHWFEVASGTPELWAFWGNTLKQWSQRYQRSGVAPLDLVLFTQSFNGDGNDIRFGGSLREALLDRAAHNSIRSIHLRGWDVNLLRSVVSSLTPDGGEIRYSRIESLKVEQTDVDISNFLTRHHFPRLRVLHLETTTISSWDHLKLQAASLTTLSLKFTRTQRSPTTSQLLSILASYPNLQDLQLGRGAIPHKVGDQSMFRIPRLKKLDLMGDCYHVFRLLNQLEHPDRLDMVYLDLVECVQEEVLEFLESYLRDRVRRDERFQDRLAIRTSCTSNFITFGINTFGEFNIPTMMPGRGYPYVSFMALFADRLPRGAGEKLCINLAALASRERVVEVDFTGEFRMRDLLATMPNVESLCLTGSAVADMFLQQDLLSWAKVLPSLRRLCLDNFTLQNDDDWSPLITYLTHQTSGGRAISLKFRWGYPHVPPEVVKKIEGLVEVFNLGYPY